MLTGFTIKKLLIFSILAELEQDIVAAYLQYRNIIMAQVYVW
jgi:hypothetical protein